MTAHYDSPEAWSAGADPAYEALGRAVVRQAPRPFDGGLVVDLGAGTGATGRAIAEARGRPLAVDLSHAMLRHRRVERPPAVVADIARLPLPRGVAAACVAAFSLSHVEDPGAVLAEMRRVTTPRGSVLVGLFACSGIRHEAATVVEEAAVRRGFVVPDWYVRLKTELEPRSSSVDTLRSCSERAGLVETTIVDVEVDAGLDTASALVDWRLAGPAMASFVAGLGPVEAGRLRAEAIRSLGEEVAPLRPAVRVLASTAPASP